VSYFLPLIILSFFFSFFSSWVQTNSDDMENHAVPKGGWEASDRHLEAAASREALEEGPTLLFLFPSPHLLILLFALSLCSFSLSLQTAGVRGTITRFVITIPTASATYHFYELDVASLDHDWLERNERRREWVDYAEALRRLTWKTELAQGLRASSLGRWPFAWNGSPTSSFIFFKY